jgi:hypothetical protein
MGGCGGSCSRELARRSGEDLIKTMACAQGFSYIYCLRKTNKKLIQIIE